MEIGAIYTRKAHEYKVVAKVPHASKEGVFVHMVAMREFGFSDVEYITVEGEFYSGYSYEGVESE